MEHIPLWALRWVDVWRRARWAAGGDRLTREALVSHELDTGTPVFSAAPISPERRCRTNAKWMQQHADAGSGTAFALPSH